MKQVFLSHYANIRTKLVKPEWRNPPTPTHSILYKKKNRIEKKRGREEIKQKCLLDGIVGRGLGAGKGESINIMKQPIKNHP